MQAGGADSSPVALRERVKKATQRIESTEKQCTEALNKAKALSATSTELAVKQCEQALQKQQAAVVELQKSLTQDIAETRKGGNSAASFVAELSKLSPRIKTLQTSLVAALSQSKGLVEKAQHKVQEEQEARELKDSLPAALELVGSAEEAVQIVAQMAGLLEEPPEESGELVDKSLEEVEATATEAQNKVTEAKKQITAKLQAARKFASETRKNALAEFGSMQQKLSEAQKKLNPFKSFKKDFHGRVELRKALAEISKQLEAAEVEVEKAAMMSIGADRGQMSEDEVSSMEKVLKPAQQAIAAAGKQLDQKLQMAVATSDTKKDELVKMKDRVSANLEALLKVLATQREGLSAKEMVKVVGERVDKLEASMSACQEAEMPFLKGIEILPPDESGKALAESETAAVKADAALAQAKNALRMRLTEAKRYPKELASRTLEELKAQERRLEGIAKKLQNFKKETAERKTAAMLAEAYDAVTLAEKKVEAMGKACEALPGESLDGVEPAALKAPVDEAINAEKEATTAFSEAKKTLAAKHKECKAGESSATALAKLQGRLNTAQTELAKLRKTAASGEKLVKGKEVLLWEEGRIKDVEAQIEKSEAMAKPSEGEEKASDEAIEAMGTAMTAAQKTLKAASKTLEVVIGGAPPALKTSVGKLLERSKVAQEKCTALLAATKERREQVQGQAMVKEGQAKTDEAEATLVKLDEAELPFLKGVEVIPLKEATDTITESESAAAAAQGAISQVRTFIAAKSLEVKHFGEATSKSISEELAKLTERVNQAASKVAQFKKDTEARKKIAQMQEAGEKVTATEQEVKKTAEAVEPFTQEGAENMSAEDAAEFCEKLIAQLKGCHASAEEAKTFLAARFKDAKGNAVHTETLEKLQVRLKEATVELAKHRKVASLHEQKYVAKKLLGQANEQISKAEEDNTKAAAACAPLLEEGGERFLVASSVETLAEALRQHAEEKGLSDEALFAELSSGGSASEEDFLAYLEKLPERIGHEEVAFSPERRVAIFKYIDIDGDGAIGPTDFKDIFKRTFVCVKDVSATDTFEVKDSKTVAKIKRGDTLEAVASTKETNGSKGMMRLQVRVVATGETGYVTMQGNSGTKFVEQVTPFKLFCQQIDKVIADTLKGVGRIASLLSAKTKELQNAGKEGPLAEAREEIGKLRPRITDAQTAAEQLKKKVAAARRDFAKKEESERNAHIEAREKKEADALTAPAVEKMEALEAAAQALEEAAKPLLSVEGAELLAFPTPLSIRGEAYRLVEAVNESVKAAKDRIIEQQSALPKNDTLKGAMLDAKRELTRLAAKAESVRRQCAATVSNVKKACQKIADARQPEVASALRKDMQKRGVTIERLFLDIVTAGDERISEEAFCKYLSALEGQDFQAEHVALLCRGLEAGGIGRRKFQAFMQRYFVVVKAIAITNEFEISKGKTLRKAELDEVIEVLEGPITEDGVGVTRVRGRSLSDDVEGWITLKGNQGTPFLKEVEKPYYVCLKDMILEADSKAEDSEARTPVRTLKADEVLELLQGPKKEATGPALRLKAKAALDGATGWLTARNKRGTVFAEAEDKYYSCLAVIAMTDSQDIKQCKVVRKLAVGELFVVEEGPTEEADVVRVKGKSLKDDAVGWVTVKGNAGTLYAEVSKKHYSVVQEVPLQKRLSSPAEGENLRMLAKGEAMLVMEGPKEQCFPPEVRIKCKALSDGAEGWLVLQEGAVKTWSPFYICKKATPLHETLAVDGSRVLRQLDIGEGLELIEGPTDDAGELRIKVSTVRDGVVGWATARDKAGKRFLES